MTMRITRLPNGMRVATDRMEGVETASLGIWVGVGTRNEPAEVNGVAHLLEHMAFKGTERRSARDIAEAIEDVGGHLNAYTTREQTAYYAKVLAEDAGLAVSILADILQHSVFDPDELARERAVVLQEIGQANDTPDDIVFDIFQETVFPDQPLGRPILGTVPIVERLSRADLTTYLRGHYAADTMVAIAAGRIDHEWFEGEIAAAFGDLPKTAAAAPAPARYQGGARIVARDLEQVHLVAGFPGVAALDDDFYAFQLYSTLLGGGMSSRLFQEVREKRGLVYSVYSFTASYLDDGVFGIYAGTGEHEVEELLPVLAGEIEQVALQVSDAELARARAQLRAGYRMARESTSARAEFLAQHILVQDRLVPIEEVLAELDRVGVDDIRRIGARVAKATPTLVALGPEVPAPVADRFAARFG